MTRGRVFTVVFALLAVVVLAGCTSSAPAGEEDLTARMATNAKLTITYRESLGNELATTFESQCHRFDQMLASFGSQD